MRAVCCPRIIVTNPPVDATTRRFNRPDGADAEKISAHGKNGVLEIVIPKHERLQPRKISVKVSD